MVSGHLKKIKLMQNYNQELTIFINPIDLRATGGYITNSMAYGTRRFNAAFTKALQ